jgi:hypothetical protein
VIGNISWYFKLYSEMFVEIERKYEHSEKFMMVIYSLAHRYVGQNQEIGAADAYYEGVIGREGYRDQDHEKGER